MQSTALPDVECAAVRPYGFSHQLFAADAGKVGELSDAFSTVVRVFEFLPLLRFRSTHLAGWLRRRFERMVTPSLADQKAVIARTQLSSLTSQR